MTELSSTQIAIRLDDQELVALVALQRAIPRIFGLWAARLAGMRGPPRDIDVLVVGDTPHGDLHTLAATAGKELGQEVNIAVVDTLTHTGRMATTHADEMREALARGWVLRAILYPVDVREGSWRLGTAVPVA
jgi:hypothetical protein